MPKRKKTATKQKQKQSQRQSVVVNIGTSKSKPRKSSGRGGLPPPSYQHNLAPTFITAPQVDYTPILGAIAGLTARLQPEPRIENPATPLSSMTQVATQTAQQMEGEKAEQRRDGPTAGNFQDHPSQVRAKVELPIGAPFPRPEPSKKKVEEPIPEPILGSVKGRQRNAQMELSYIAQQQKALQQRQATQMKALAEEASGVVNAPRKAEEEPTSKPKTGLEQAQEAIEMTKKALKSTPIQRERAKQQTIQRKQKLDDISKRFKSEGREALTSQDLDFVKKTRGTKMFQKQLGILD